MISLDAIRTTITPVLSSALLGVLAACSASDVSTPETPQTDDLGWPPSEEHEATYSARFDATLEAFSKGLETTTYDTLGPVRGADPVNRDPVPSSSKLQPEITEAIDAFAEANNSQALIVYQAGEFVHESYFGETTVDTLIVGKSLAKPLGVIAVGAAIQAGKIDSLDQPVSDFITEWRDTDREGILVRHLLDMRTGLLPQSNSPDRDHILNRAYLHPRHEEVIILEYPVVGPPGERYDYSNANSELVAPLIERATGVPYEDWIAERVLIPLGAAGGEVWMNRPGGTPHAGCCILLPARTFLSLGTLLINDGVSNGTRILPEGFVAEMRTPTASNPHAGMGVYIGQPYTEYRGFLNPEIPFGRSYHSAPYIDEDLFLFDGNSNQVVYMIPSKDLVILRVGSRPLSDPAWDNAYLPNMISQALDAQQ